MIATQPNVSLDGRYSIAETCKLLGVHRNTLMNYTRDGKIICGFRRVNFRKFYLGREIVRFWNAQL